MEFAHQEVQSKNGSEGLSNCADEYDSDIETERIDAFTFHLKLAESEYNEEKKTLFATHIWHGSRTLANYICNESDRQRFAGAAVLEFGAGAGIPSLVCHHLNAKFVCASDYPVDSLIHVLRENVERNCTLPTADHDIKAMGYKW
jgi:predicted nicotinamide N-methyase